MTASTAPLRLGVLGLGRAFTLMLPTFTGDARVVLRAAFDPRPQAREAFAKVFGGTAHASAEAVCADPDVEWVYVATPHQLHAQHVALAAAHGKHVLVEKPMALTLADAARMVRACHDAGVQLVVGHSHSFNAPVLVARSLILSGRWGAVRMVHALQYTDFLYRPRRPEELDTAQGGGVVFSQAAHQIDVVRLLAGGLAQTVRAQLGRWDPARPTEGAYSALLRFANGAFANATYCGYGHFDTDAWMDGIGELGTPKALDAHRQTRARLAAAQGNEAAEIDLKAERNFGGRAFQMPAATPRRAFQHFGPVLVSCDGGDFRLTPFGVEIHDAQGCRLEPCALAGPPRSEVIDELWRSAREGQRPLHGGEWSLATLEVCLAMLASGEQGEDVALQHQVAPADAPLPPSPARHPGPAAPLA